MFAINCLKKMFVGFDCTKESKVFIPIEVEAIELDGCIVSEKKTLTIEEADTDNSEEEQEQKPVEDVSEVRPAAEDELEFNCDERELIRILEEKEKENDEEHNRFSMC
jgi:hypothetical protein